MKCSAGVRFLAGEVSSGAATVSDSTWHSAEAVVSLAAGDVRLQRWPAGVVYCGLQEQPRLPQPR